VVWRTKDNISSMEKWFEGRRTIIYVDDCFLIFRRSEHVQLFLTYLNRQHTNIRFTIVRLNVMVSSQFWTLTYSALMENVPLLFTVNLRLLVFLPTSIASFHLHTNAA
jgi:hypothetical protein